MDTTRNRADALVIGGGPGGSTIATLLRRKGWQVVLCEKDRHPRFHIGESLLPLNLPIFQQLGVLDQVRDIGVVKYGAEFSANGPANEAETIYFADALDKKHPYAFQVKRSEFDHLLLNNSAKQGVIVHEGMTIKDVIFGSGPTHLVRGIDERGARHEWETRFVVDATGRDTFLAGKLGLRQKNKVHQSAAVFGHFNSVSRRSGKNEGNISIYWFQHGWFWMIPLREDTVSVGAVCWPEYLKTRRKDLDAFLWDTIALCPGVTERMRRAQLVGKARAAGNFSYRAKRMYGKGYVLVGDAFAFVDPVFSSGVYLAMNSATAGAQAVDAALRDLPCADRLMREFDHEVRRGLAMFSWFIYRFTSPVMQELFMAPRKLLRMKEAVISVLSGDVFRNRKVQLPIALFRGVYYLTWAMNWGRSWSAYRRRRLNARMTLSDDGLHRVSR